MSEDESKDIISLKIAGIDYQLYCPEDEQETLLVAAEYLNKKIKKLKRQTKFLSVEKVAILAGLEITNEMMSSSQDSNKDPEKDNVKVDENIIESSVELDDSKEALEDSLSLKLVDEISELSKL
jgi:cell division protein ZapA